jgi:hypothetical protein
MPNETIHKEIEEWLTADVHDQLSDEERAAFQQHLVACASCHALQQEEKQMHQLLEDTLARESADPAFEQRMVSRFRDRVSRPNGGLASLLAGLMRMRAAQIAAVAALLLTLVQVGKMVTGERGELSRAGSLFAFASRPALDEKSAETEQTIVAGSNIPAAAEVTEQAKAYRSTDALAAGGPTELKMRLADKSKAPAAPSSVAEVRQKESDRPDKSDAAQANQVEGQVAATPATTTDSRKLIRNAQLDLQVVNYEVALQRLTTFASEEKGFVATQSSSKLPNGKLHGTVVVKIVPENLDRFLQKARGLGELKNQTLGTEDVTKAYFDTDARLRNAKRMEERLLQMLDKNTGKVSDLLQVEKELGRVREEIEQMQGELKYYDALVQYDGHDFPGGKRSG